jgi:Zn-finger nucleic acid-binding protein
MKKNKYYPVYIANPENCPHDGIKVVRFFCPDCGCVWIDKPKLKQTNKKLVSPSSGEEKGTK